MSPSEESYSKRRTTCWARLPRKEYGHNIIFILSNISMILFFPFLTFNWFIFSLAFTFLIVLSYTFFSSSQCVFPPQISTVYKPSWQAIRVIKIIWAILKKSDMVHGKCLIGIAEHLHTRQSSNGSVNWHLRTKTIQTNFISPIKYIPGSAGTQSWAPARGLQ